MRTAKHLLEDFQDMGSRSALDLKDGRHYEGYLLEVGDMHVLFGVGGPEAPEAPVQIPIEHVDLGSLSYWDEALSCWMDARWDEGHAGWSHRPSGVGG